MSQDASRDANVNLKADVTDYRSGVQGATQDTNTLANAVDALAGKLDGLQRRVGKKMTLFAAADLAMMSTMVAMSASYEKQLSTLSAQAAITGRSVSGVSGELRQLSREMGTSRAEIVATATAISKMGLSAQSQIGGMTEVFIKTGKAAGESATGIANAMITLSRQMGTLDGGAATMQKYTDSLLKVSSTAGVSAQSVAEFANSIAPISKMAGISEKSVLGLSAAFVQAGNDGYVAANTFNSMLSDIVRQTQTGGPGLAKYAAIVGKTVDQFKQLGKADQVMQVFKAINSAGPNAIQILDRMGIDGIRAAKAIQTMASQSGGLEKLVQTAMGGYGDGSTDTGYSATKGLTDAFEELRNITQDIGTSIGQFWLTPLTKSLGVLNTMLGQAAKLSGVFQAGGALAGVGGLAMGGAGIFAQIASFLAPVAALNWLRNSRGAGAFKDAFGSGRAFAGGNLGALRDTSTMTRFERFAYGMGANLGGIVGPTAPGGAGPGMRERIGGMIPRLYTAGINDMTRFYSESSTPRYLQGVQSGSMSLTAALRGAVTGTEGFRASMWEATKATGNFVRAQGVAGLRGVGQMGGGALMRGLGSAAGSMMNFLGGPVGIALMAGMGGLQLKNMADEKQDQIRARTNADYSSAIPYQSLLGQTTTALQGFASAVASSAAAVGSLEQAARRVTSNPAGGTITGSGAYALKTAAQGAAYLRSLGTTDPATVQAAMRDVKNQLGAAEGNAAIAQYMAGPSKAPTLGDVSTAAGAIGSQGAVGIGDFLNDFVGTGIKINDEKALDNAFSSANAYADSIRSKYGDKAGNQAQLLAYQKILDQVGTSRPAMHNAAMQRIEATSGIRFNSTFGSNQSAGQWTGSELLGMDAVTGVSDMGKTGAAGESNLNKLMVTSTNPVVAGLRRRGFDISSGILKDVETGSQDSGTLATAVRVLYARARDRAKGDINKVGSILQGIKAEVDQSDPLYALASQAQGLAGVDQQYSDVYQGRVGRLRGVQARYNAVMNEAPTPESGGRQQAAYQELQSSKASYYQYLQGMVRTQENFALQMKRSDEDYYRQRGYAQADFQTSSRHSYEDYAKSVLRMQQDAAKTIYNPFQRVYSTYTADVGTVKQNLADQTSRIKKQVANLRKLKKMGLSQQVIDMLDLANPSNAQQVEELVQEMTKNDISSFNSLASQRQSATNSLVTSDLNSSYTLSAKDFQISMARGLEEFNKGMARMAAARKTQQARAKEDLDLMSKEYVGDFTTMFGKAQALVKKNLGKTGQITMDELNAIKAAFPEFFTAMDGTASNGPGSNSANTPGEHSGYRASTTSSVRNTTTNTRTVNSRTVSTTNYNISGPIAVSAGDPATLAVKMAALAKAKKLRGSNAI